MKSNASGPRQVTSNASDSLSVREERFDSPVVQRLISDWDDELRARIPWFSPSGGSTVSASDFTMPHGAFLVVGDGERAVGCGGVRRLGDGVGEIKRLFVASAARGQRVGRTLVLAAEVRARSLGYKTLRLDIDGGEPAALGLFRSLGYQAIDDYNGNPYASYWFEKQLG